jgi:hypothetical protein
MQTVQEIHNCSSVIDTAESGMRRTKEHGKLRLLILSAATCGFLMTLFLAQMANAQQGVAKPADSQKTGSATVGSVGRFATGEEADETPKPGKPSGEGIKIHGHWVLQVKNPDGTLGERREFNNSLVTGGNRLLTGDAILAALLSGNASAGDPSVLLMAQATNGTGTNPGDVCWTDSVAGVSVACFALTTGKQPYGNLGVPPAIPNGQTGLVTTVNFTPTVSWVLTGNYTVGTNFTTLNAVQTFLSLCVSLNGPTAAGTPDVLNPGFLSGSFQGRSADLPSQSCAGATFETPSGEFALFGAFTSTTLPTALTGLVPGQIIMISVTITFS